MSCKTLITWALGYYARPQHCIIFFSLSNFWIFTYCLCSLPEYKIPEGMAWVCLLHHGALHSQSIWVPENNSQIRNESSTELYFFHPKATYVLSTSLSLDRKSGNVPNSIESLIIYQSICFYVEDQETWFFLLLFLKLTWERDRERERGRGREREILICRPTIYALIGWFLYVPWPGIKPTTLAYGDDALTTWAIQPLLFHS